MHDIRDIYVCFPVCSTTSRFCQDLVAKTAGSDDAKASNGRGAKNHRKWRRQKSAQKMHPYQGCYSRQPDSPGVCSGKPIGSPCIHMLK